MPSIPCVALLLAWGAAGPGCGDDSTTEGPAPSESLPDETTGGEGDVGETPVADAPGEDSAGEAPRDEVTAGGLGPDGMCGGIAGFVCPEGQWCDLEGDYPDASGHCREEGTCDAPEDCATQDLVHPMCVGAWTCTNGECGWECETG